MKARIQERLEKSMASLMRELAAAEIPAEDCVFTVRVIDDVVSVEDVGSEASTDDGAEADSKVRRRK